jgi:hypothetical protein
MHLDEHQIHGLVDGELSTSAAAAARDHMTGCDDCRRRVVDAERAASDVEALLRGLDDPAPHVGAESIAAEAHARDVAVWRRAAGLVFAAGLVGAAYAAPGSPVPTWMRAGPSGRAVQAARRTSSPGDAAQRRRHCGRARRAARHRVRDATARRRRASR